MIKDEENYKAGTRTACDANCPCAKQCPLQVALNESEGL